jgi:serine/threonine protein kinase
VERMSIWRRVSPPPTVPPVLTLSIELLFDEDYSSSIDIFSFGIVLLEILGRKHAGMDDFAVRKPQSNFVLDREVVQADIPDSAPPSLVMLALQCTEYETSSRPLAEDVYGENPPTLPLLSDRPSSDWLSDLHDSTPNDEIPRPTLKPITLIPDPPISQQPALPPTPAQEEIPKVLKLLRPSDSLTAEQQPLTEKTLREMYALNEGGTNTILKAGYIFKRNRNGSASSPVSAHHFDQASGTGSPAGLS